MALLSQAASVVQRAAPVRGPLPRIANAGFGLLFAFSATVQLNDPDPLPWLTVYAAASLACLAWERRWWPRWLPVATAAVGAAALLGGIAGAFALRLQVPWLAALSDWDMRTSGAEVLRETCGLLLVTGWMFALTRERALRE